ncbi:L,D-transpeptidase family protein [Streptomyces sp. NPDC046759]|uniref:L,D-transpeptidase family protein n=1 Tax=Streptomyces sp. NPDC046759 TaxID=3155019 RepID=UPI0033EF8C3D
MKIHGVRRMTVGLTALGTLLATLSACGADGSGPARADRAAGPSGRAVKSPTVSTAAPTIDRGRLPGVGDQLFRRIPDDSGQVVVVYGEGEDSADSTAVLYTREGPEWREVAGWPAHNGRRGWTTDHHMGDERSPVGVFGLSDAGGVLADPGTRLPYDRDEGAYAPPNAWDEAHQHDFDYVIAIDYNRLPGTPPNDPTRPEGDDKGGSIWLHLDHGDGTSGCVSVSKEAMAFLLRTLDPARRPVMVMGDRTELRA